MSDTPVRHLVIQACSPFRKISAFILFIYQSAFISFCNEWSRVSRVHDVGGHDCCVTNFPILLCSTSYLCLGEKPCSSVDKLRICVVTVIPAGCCVLLHCCQSLCSRLLLSALLPCAHLLLPCCFPVLFLSLLWHPISLIVFLLLMAAWLFLYFLRDHPFVLLGHVAHDRLVLLFMAVLTVALLLLTDAALNITVAVLIGGGGARFVQEDGGFVSRKKNRLMGFLPILMLLLLDFVTVS
ncbi:Prenylated rab acceptor PRA1 [Sesbania bispinosa]|nr:Prenylated rab acceptor PRA1 [Sesbania bispinosa]